MPITIIRTDALAFEDLPLVGVPPADKTDGVPLGLDQVVFLVGQLNKAQNGPWRIKDLEWERHEEFNDAANMQPQTFFVVTQGTEGNRGSLWSFSNVVEPDPNVTELTFIRRDWGGADTDGPGIEREGRELRLPLREAVQGIFPNPTIEYDDRGVAEDVTAGTFPPDYIHGARLEYVSANSIRITQGVVWVPGAEVGKLLSIDPALLKSGLVLAGATTYYVYAWDNGGVEDVEITTQVPASPYYGLGRVKGGPDNITPDVTPDPSRRLVGQFTTGAANTINSAWIYSEADATEAKFGIVKAANQTQAEAGIVNYPWFMSPLRTKQAIVANAASVRPDHKEGLEIERVNNTNVKIHPGSLWVPGLNGGAGGLLELDAALTKSGLTYAANSWIWLYAWENAGAFDVEFTTTAPAAPYFGRQARTKTGDTTRRLFAVIRTGQTADTILRFRNRDGWIIFHEDPSQPASTTNGTRIIGAIGNTAFAQRDCSPRVPSICDHALLWFFTNATSGAEINLDPTEATTIPMTVVRSGGLGIVDAPLTAAQMMSHRNSLGGGSTDIGVLAYPLEV